MACNPPCFGMRLADVSAAPEYTCAQQTTKGGSPVTELTAENRVAHWRRTRNLMIGHLSVWFVFAYGVHLFAYQLNSINFFGWPLGYYFAAQDRKSTRLNSSHVKISYAVFCLKKK